MHKILQQVRPWEVAVCGDGVSVRPGESGERGFNDLNYTQVTFSPRPRLQPCVCVSRQGDAISENWKLKKS